MAHAFAGVNPERSARKLPLQVKGENGLQSEDPRKRKTIGDHNGKQWLDLGLGQQEAAHILGIRPIE